MITQQDSQRAQYCSCVRNGMRGWDEQTYEQIIAEQAKSQQTPAQLDALAKSCIDKVLK